MKNKCIVCGRPARRIKLPAGSICLCKNRGCLDTVNLGINHSIPIAVFSMDDLGSGVHDIVDDEILDKYKSDVETVALLASDVEQYVWAGETMGEMFHSALADAGQKLELWHIENTKGKELLCIPMSMLHSEEAKQALEKKLKGGS
jgi:hypothetical protein